MVPGDDERAGLRLAAGECRQHVQAENDEVETAIVLVLEQVRLDEVECTPGRTARCGPRHLRAGEHGRIVVNTDHVVAVLGNRDGESSGATAEVEHVLPAASGQREV